MFPLKFKTAIQYIIKSSSIFDLWAAERQPTDILSEELSSGPPLHLNASGLAASVSALLTQHTHFQSLALENWNYHIYVNIK
jgi:hypothetical protein